MQHSMTRAAAQALRRAGHHAEAKDMLVSLAAQHPGDASLQYDAACVHDFLGEETAAIPYYLAAIAGNLPDAELRSALLGLGSTYRTLGRYAEAEATLQRGLERFPEANEIKVFLAMVRHNLGRSKEAVEALLVLLADTSSDEQIQAYRGAIAFYAQDIERTWVSQAPDDA
jgi:tetratricopeptide (TPR) repeat protein